MAGVLNSLASYVTKMLADMARDEVAMLIGVSGGIDDLSIKLRDLKNFLADADRRNITDESVREWVEELKRVMYLATDILDLCQLKVMEQGPSKDMGCLNPLLFCMRNPLHAHDIGSRIKTLNKKLDEICKRGESFNFIKLEAYEERKTNQSLATDRKTDSLMERSGAVGEKIDEDTRALVEVLTREGGDDKSDSLMVVAIVGVGGIGKTTLGKKVFNHEVIEGTFSKKIWLSITKDFNDVELLSTAIIAAGGDLPGGGGAQQKGQLVISLRNAIRDKKFFLLLDDMWGVDAWDKILMIPFSYGDPNSRVVITTRHQTVARSMKACHYHHVDKLCPEDAWSLLKKQVLTSEINSHEVDMLKGIGLQIIAKCDGLPLAVKVVGGLLCKKDITQRDWEDVLSNDIWSVSQIPEEINYAIYLSYEDLPSCLKQCFLHFSLKPKNCVLSLNEIVTIWIGEGLVHGDPCSLEEEGAKYYKELILRNLIEIDANYPGQLISNMHDVILSFAHFMAKDEALVARSGDISESNLRSYSFLRLSIETKAVESDGFEWRYLAQQKSLRTLILSGKFQIQQGDSLITLSSLRTLFVDSSSFAALVQSVCQLKHLRHLALKNCSDISSLPENIHEIKLLQSIDLSGCEGIVKLPRSIVKLRELRYLNIEDTHVSSIPRGFSALTNLRILWGFPSYMEGDWCSLEELGPLSHIKDLGLTGLDSVSTTASMVKARVCAKVHLTEIAFKCGSRLGDDGLLNGVVSEEELLRIELVFDVLCPLPCLELLGITGYFGRHLPRWMMRTAEVPLENLRTLLIKDLACCTQLPDGLCRLPRLEYIGFCRAPAIKHVGPEFVQPNNHRYHSSSQVVPAFPTLREMVLGGLLEWEEWEWEEEVQAMPALVELVIQRCSLRFIPPGLSFQARSLKILTLGSVTGLHSLENFASVVVLTLYNIPNLIRMSNFPKLQKLEIKLCPKLKSLQEMNALRKLMLTVFYKEKQLPTFLQTVKPVHLLLDCSLFVLSSMPLGKSGPEWEKFNHIQRVEAYSNDKGIEKRWHVFYTREPYSMETNYSYEEWLEFHGRSPRDEAGANADNNQEKNEEEAMGPATLVEEGGLAN